MKRANLFILLLTTFVFTAISCSSVKISEKQKKAEDIVKTKIVSATTPAYFDKYFKFLPEKYSESNSDVNIVAAVKIPELEYTDTLIFRVAGNNVENFSTLRDIPDCFEDTTKCEFNINKEKLLKILKDKKLLEEHNSFIVKTIWDDKEKRFLWKVTITKESYRVGDRVRGHGIFVFVNPASGEIVKTEEWKVM